MNRKEKRKKGHYFYLSDKANTLIDSHIAQTSAKSRSDFVCDAIDFYCCELDSDNHRNVITTEMSRVIRDNIKNLENHLAHILFKLAVEQAKINLVLADKSFDMEDKEVSAYGNAAYDIVRRNNGFISFEDAIADARSIAESDGD
ncbi:MAG: hypothetical protein J6128_02505 [Clostridia bacterium]|nr:hypothetical protein [Clostridia bacterium]